jgi:hypothetical protein
MSNINHKLNLEFYKIRPKLLEFRLYSNQNQNTY